MTEWGFGDTPLVAEPGRVIRGARLLADRACACFGRAGGSTINDGIWASLSDSWTGKITLPAPLIPGPGDSATAMAIAKKIVPFKVCGATCDQRRHPVSAVLAAGDGGYRRLDRDRPYRGA